MKLCHKRLRSKHRTPACKRTNTCEVDGCSVAFHHGATTVDQTTLNRIETTLDRNDI